MSSSIPPESAILFAHLDQAVADLSSGDQLPTGRANLVCQDALGMVEPVAAEASLPTKAVVSQIDVPFPEGAYNVSLQTHGNNPQTWLGMRAHDRVLAAELVGALPADSKTWLSGGLFQRVGAGIGDPQVNLLAHIVRGDQCAVASALLGSTAPHAAALRDSVISGSFYTRTLGLSVQMGSIDEEGGLDNAFIGHSFSLAPSRDPSDAYLLGSFTRAQPEPTGAAAAAAGTVTAGPWHGALVGSMTHAVAAAPRSQGILLSGSADTREAKDGGATSGLSVLSTASARRYFDLDFRSSARHILVAAPRPVFSAVGGHFLSVPSFPDLMRSHDQPLATGSGTKAPTAEACSFSVGAHVLLPTAGGQRSGPCAVLSTPTYGLGLDSHGRPVAWLRGVRPEPVAAAAAASLRGGIAHQLEAWWDAPAPADAGFTYLPSSVVVASPAPLGAGQWHSLEVRVLRGAADAVALVLCVDGHAVSGASGHLVPRAGDGSDGVFHMCDDAGTPASPLVIGADIELNLLAPVPSYEPGQGPEGFAVQMALHSAAATAAADATSFPELGPYRVTSARAFPGLIANVSASSVTPASRAVHARECAQSPPVAGALLGLWPCMGEDSVGSDFSGRGAHAILRTLAGANTRRGTGALPPFAHMPPISAPEEVPHCHASVPGAVGGKVRPAVSAPARAALPVLAGSGVDGTEPPMPLLLSGSIDVQHPYSASESALGRASVSLGRPVDVRRGFQTMVRADILASGTTTLRLTLHSATAPWQLTQSDLHLLPGAAGAASAGGDLVTDGREVHERSIAAARPDAGPLAADGESFDSLDADVALANGVVASSTSGVAVTAAAPRDIALGDVAAATADGDGTAAKRRRIDESGTAVPAAQQHDASSSSSAASASAAVPTLTMPRLPRPPSARAGREPEVRPGSADHHPLTSQCEQYVQACSGMLVIEVQITPVGLEVPQPQTQSQGASDGADGVSTLAHPLVLFDTRTSLCVFDPESAAKQIATAGRRAVEDARAQLASQARAATAPAAAPAPDAAPSSAGAQPSGPTSNGTAPSSGDGAGGASSSGGAAMDVELSMDQLDAQGSAAQAQTGGVIVLPPPPAAAAPTAPLPAAAAVASSSAAAPPRAALGPLKLNLATSFEGLRCARVSLPAAPQTAPAGAESALSVPLSLLVTYDGELGLLSLRMTGSDGADGASPEATSGSAAAARVPSGHAREVSAHFAGNLGSALRLCTPGDAATMSLTVLADPRGSGAPVLRLGPTGLPLLDVAGGCTVVRPPLSASPAPCTLRRWWMVPLPGRVRDRRQPLALGDSFALDQTSTHERKGHAALPAVVPEPPPLPTASRAANPASSATKPSTGAGAQASQSTAGQGGGSMGFQLASGKPVGSTGKAAPTYAQAAATASTATDMLELQRMQSQAERGGNGGGRDVGATVGGDKLPDNLMYVETRGPPAPAGGFEPRTPPHGLGASPAKGTPPTPVHNDHSSSSAIHVSPIGGGAAASSSYCTAGGGGGERQQVSCPACTFLNPSSRYKCDICGTELRGAGAAASNSSGSGMVQDLSDRFSQAQAGDSIRHSDAWLCAECFRVRPAYQSERCSAYMGLGSPSCKAYRQLGILVRDLNDRDAHHLRLATLALNGQMQGVSAEEQAVLRSFLADLQARMRAKLPPGLSEAAGGSDGAPPLVRDPAAISAANAKGPDARDTLRGSFDTVCSNPNIYGAGPATEGGPRKLPNPYAPATEPVRGARSGKGFSSSNKARTRGAHATKVATERRPDWRTDNGVGGLVPGDLFGDTSAQLPDPYQRRSGSVGGAGGGATRPDYRQPVAGLPHMESSRGAATSHRGGEAPPPPDRASDNGSDDEGSDGASSTAGQLDAELIEQLTNAETSVENIANVTLASVASPASAEPHRSDAVTAASYGDVAASSPVARSTSALIDTAGAPLLRAQPDWSCGVCTFINAGTRGKCEMCDGPRTSTAIAIPGGGGGGGDGVGGAADGAEGGAREGSNSRKRPRDPSAADAAGTPPTHAQQHQQHHPTAPLSDSAERPCYYHSDDELLTMYRDADEVHTGWATALRNFPRLGPHLDPPDWFVELAGSSFLSPSLYAFMLEEAVQTGAVTFRSVGYAQAWNGVIGGSLRDLLAATQGEWVDRGSIDARLVGSGLFDADESKWDPWTFDAEDDAALDEAAAEGGASGNAGEWGGVDLSALLSMEAAGLGLPAALAESSAASASTAAPAPSHANAGDDRVVIIEPFPHMPPLNPAEAIAFIDAGDRDSCMHLLRFHFLLLRLQEQYGARPKFGERPARLKPEQPWGGTNSLGWEVALLPHAERWIEQPLGSYSKGEIATPLKIMGSPKRTDAEVPVPPMWDFMASQMRKAVNSLSSSYLMALEDMENGVYGKPYRLVARPSTVVPSPGMLSLLAAEPQLQATASSSPSAPKPVPSAAAPAATAAQPTAAAPVPHPHAPPVPAPAAALPAQPSPFALLRDRSRAAHDAALASARASSSGSYALTSLYGVTGRWATTLGPLILSAPAFNAPRDVSRDGLLAAPITRHCLEVGYLLRGTCGLGAPLPVPDAVAAALSVAQAADGGGGQLPASAASSSTATGPQSQSAGSTTPAGAWDPEVVAAVRDADARALRTTEGAGAERGRLTALALFCEPAHANYDDPCTQRRLFLAYAQVHLGECSRDSCSHTRRGEFKVPS